MLKRLLKRLSKLRESLLAMTFVHLGVIVSAAIVLGVLAKSGVLSEPAVRTVPNDYTYLKGMESVDLEQKLKTKSPDVVGLITFEKVRHIVVLGPGFEKDKIVANAEVDEMVKLAKAANLPVTLVASVTRPGEFSLLFWLPLLGILVWFGIFLFRPIYPGMPNRVMYSVEYCSAYADEYIQKKNCSRMRFWLTVWGIAFGVLALVSVSRVLHNSPVQLLPAEYGVQRVSPQWQAERALNAYPTAFQRAVVIEGTNAVAVVLEFPDNNIVGGESEKKKAEEAKKPEGDAKTPAGPTPVTLARVTLFERTPAGYAAASDYVSELREKKVSVKTVPGEFHNGWAETMGPVALGLHIVLGVTLLLTLLQIIGKSQEWKAAEQPVIKRNGAAAGGGGTTTTNHLAKVKDKSRKTLADVAGCDEAIAKLRLVVEWMKDSKAYEHYGAKLPNGVLLYGPPGTGKTLLARAVAGEIDGNFFHASASEFVEMYVGVGARRVRDFFAQGTNAYRRTGKVSVLFLDELDAVGKKRSDGGTGGDSERDQTVNQLLTCIQGFDANSGCLLIAATNRPETLDEGLKRSGRFDFKIEVSKPDRKGRQAIFRVHGKKADLEPGVDREQLYMELARRAHDFTGADIELAINEALTRAAKRNASLFVGKSDEEIAKLPRTVSRVDFNDGIDFVLYGELIKSRVRTDKERWATAVHEIGHATIPTVKNGDPVSRITIVMTTKSLGLMESYTEEERYGWSKDQFIQRIKTMLAGRAAEELIAGEISTGASNDFERASQLARFMVGAYGMSNLGPISIPLDEFGFPRAHIGQRLEVEFDDAWRTLIRECDKETREIIEAHRAQILSSAKVLFDEETVTGDRFREAWAAGAPVVAAPTVTVAPVNPPVDPSADPQVDTTVVAVADAAVANVDADAVPADAVSAVVAQPAAGTPAVDPDAQVL